MKACSSLILAAALLLLTGCKYKFADTIDCPAFHATNVMVYKYDLNTYLVMYPKPDGIHLSKRHEMVQAEGCLVDLK